MILGYDVKRPAEANYYDFQEKLITGLTQLGFKGLSLMQFGSFERNDYDPGRSDIDAYLELPGGVVTDKGQFKACSRVLANALEGNNIPFQVSVGDPVTSADGRFNTYSDNFESYFAREGEVIVGHDPRENMRFEQRKKGDLYNLSFNFRKARFGFLMARRNFEIDYEQLLKDFNKTLDAVSRGSKQIAGKIFGGEGHRRFSGLERIKSSLTSVNIAPLERIKHLYHRDNLHELDALYRDTPALLELWESSLNTFEELVREYIERVPRD